MTSEIEKTTEVQPAAAAPAPSAAPAPLASEEIVVSAPMSFAGSATRIWRPLSRNGQETENTLVGTLWYILAILLIAVAWTCVLSWYLIFGLLVIPYRLLRRSQRKRKLDEARHRELLAATQNRPQ